VNVGGGVGAERVTVHNSEVRGQRGIVYEPKWKKESNDLQKLVIQRENKEQEFS